MLNRINFLTSGESHGKALLGIIEGIPANVIIDELYIKKHLKRRQKGYGRGGRMKIEDDYAEIISGVRLGLTLGSPIGLIIKNKDWENWKRKMPINKVDYELIQWTKESEIDDLTKIDIGFNNLSIEIVKKNLKSNQLICKVIKEGFLESKKGVHIHSNLKLPCLTKKDN